MDEAVAEIMGKLPEGVKVPNKVPVMYVNGLTGTNLYVESLNKTEDRVRPWCAKHTTERYQIWPNQLGLVPGKIHCTFDNLKLVWDDEAKEYVDRGVNIQPDLSKQGGLSE